MNSILRNTTYNNPDIREEIDQLLGKSYPIFKSISLGGTGSSKFLITDASESINNKLLLDNNLNYLSIEIRPAGIIIFFRSLLETFGWVLPFHSFELKAESDGFKIHSGKDHIHFTNNLKFNRAGLFIEKIQKLQKQHITNNKNK